MTNSELLIKNVMKAHKKNQKEHTKEKDFKATKESLSEMIQEGQIDVEISELNKIAYSIETAKNPKNEIIKMIFLFSLFVVGGGAIIYLISLFISGFIVFLGVITIGIAAIGLIYLLSFSI